jgi:N-acetylmuramidase
MTPDELTSADFERAAKTLNVEVAAIRAVAEVEAQGRGFLADGRPQALFEAHVFHAETGGKHAGAKDRNGRALSSPKWDRSLYGASGAAQHVRIEDAAKLDWDAAHRAASWGMFQIMGANHKQAGHKTVKGFVEAMHGGAGAHLDAFVAFLKANKLDEPLRKKDWARFARGYNGPAYAKNAYDREMAAAYERLSGRP